jgi:hypothetical protein
MGAEGIWRHTGRWGKLHEELHNQYSKYYHGDEMNENWDM